MPRPAELQCTSVRDRIDPWLDGDLGAREEAAVRLHLDGCAACREELQLARKLRQALRSGLPTLTCPPRVTEEVLRRARAEAPVQAHTVGVDGRTDDLRPVAAGPGWSGWWQRLHDWLVVRPAASPVASWAAVAALLLVVAAVPFVVRTVLTPEGSGRAESPRQAVQTPGRPAPADQAGVATAEYTPEQVARAERQARLVLATVAQVSRGAGRAVQDQVFEQALMRPARRAVESLEQIPGATGPAERAGTGRERRQP